eukprot:2395503-Rhodomonas_salina.1
MRVEAAMAAALSTQEKGLGVQGSGFTLPHSGLRVEGLVGLRVHGLGVEDEGWDVEHSGAGEG